MEEVGGKTNMEQNILKRYNEIHIMLWEEVLKVFSVRTNEPIEYYKTNTEQIGTLAITSLKRTALFNLFVRGKITEVEKNNLLMNANCASCFVASEERNLQCRYSACNYCPIEKWKEKDKHCNDYCTLQNRLDDLIRYITNCITHREKFRKKDLLMLCSDGVSDYISIDEVEDVLITDNELSIKADIILDKIYSNGAGDNISLILVNRL